MKAFAVWREQSSLKVFEIQFWFVFFFFFSSDPRIPLDHKVTLHFGDNNQTNDNRGLYFQSPLVKLEPLNAVAKYNSLEAIDDGKYFNK